MDPELLQAEGQKDMTELVVFFVILQTVLKKPQTLENAYWTGRRNEPRHQEASFKYDKQRNIYIIFYITLKKNYTCRKCRLIIIG